MKDLAQGNIIKLTKEFFDDEYIQDIKNEFGDIFNTNDKYEVLKTLSGIESAPYDWAVTSLKNLNTGAIHTTNQTSDIYCFLYSGDKTQYEVQ